MTTTFRAGSINPTTPQPVEPSAFEIYVSETAHKYRPGALLRDSFIRLYQDIPLPMSAMRDLWSGDSAGPKSPQLVKVLWDGFRGKLTTITEIQPLVIQPRAEPTMARQRKALVTAVMERLEGVEFPASSDMPRLVVRQRIGQRNGKYLAF